jgi:hypothetical protein
MTSLGQMADTGAGQLLRDAVVTLRERGWTQGATRQPRSGAVDVLGALAIAAGALIRDVDDRSDLLTTSVPIARRAAALVAWEALTWAVEDDPVHWQDMAGRQLDEVVKALERAALRLEIAVR